MQEVRLWSESKERFFTAFFDPENCAVEVDGELQDEVKFFLNSDGTMPMSVPKPRLSAQIAQGRFIASDRIKSVGIDKAVNLLRDLGLPLSAWGIAEQPTTEAAEPVTA